mgnify:CR=1 FL=1
MPTSARCWDFGRPSVGADDPGGPFAAHRLWCACRGRAPSRPACKVRFHTLVPKHPPPRRGGPMCPPVGRSREGPYPGRHTGRPLQNLHLPPKNRAGTEPRPYRLDTKPQADIHDPRRPFGRRSSPFWFNRKLKTISTNSTTDAFRGRENHAIIGPSRTREDVFHET